MKFLQKLGKALMLPVAVLPICGILMGIGYFLCPATMQGGDIEGVRNLIGLFLVKAGGALIDNMAILFVIGVGVGMSEKNDGTGGIAALASWLMMTTLLSTGFVTTIMPSIADSATKTLAFDKIANPFIGILAGVIGSLCYNRFKDTKLPDWLSFFSGKRCVAIIAGVVSPTVISYLERIQMNGRWISEEEFAELTEKVKEAIARLKAAGENLPTVFETETAIAFLYFRKMNCDFVVLETGLGGELDATNIVKNTVCAVFATISRDHLGVIGNTLEEIAQTKAGIIKNGCAVVSAQQKETVSEILKKRAEASDCSYREADLSRFLVEKEDYHGIRFSYKEYKNLRGSLAGECQIANLATALEVIRTLNALGISVPETAVRKGLEETRWPGRFTFLMEHPVFLVDGAHNEDAAQKLRMSMERYFPGRRLILILGVFKDKEYEKIASILCPLAQQVYTVDLPNVERTLPAEKLAECAKKYCRQTAAAGRIEDAVEKAMKAAERAGQRTADSEASAADGEPVILACGSLSYLGDVIRLVEKSYGTRTRGTGKEEK